MPRRPLRPAEAERLTIGPRALRDRIRVQARGPERLPRGPDGGAPPGRPALADLPAPRLGTRADRTSGQDVSGAGLHVLSVVAQPGDGQRVGIPLRGALL